MQPILPFNRRLDVQKIKADFGFAFRREDQSKKLLRAQRVLEEAEELASEYGTTAPLEVPDVKKLRELFAIK